MGKRFVVLGIIAGFLLVALGIGGVIFYRDSHNISTLVERNLSSAPKDYTLQQAQKDGFVDISDTIEQNATIDSFLQSASNNQWNVLKTAHMEGDSLILQLYISDNRCQCIRSYSYDVALQRGAVQVFAPQYSTTEKGDTITLWLTPIHDPSLPLPEGEANPLPPDVALYSYHKA